MSSLEDLIASARRLEGLPPETAKRAAPRIEAAIQETAGAQRAPDGKPWPARKDGRPARVHAAGHVAVKAHGTALRATLTGPDVFGHYGSGEPRRQVLPDPGEVPPSVAKAIEKAAEEAWNGLTR